MSGTNNNVDDENAGQKEQWYR